MKYRKIQSGGVVNTGVTNRMLKRKEARRIAKLKAKGKL